MNNYKITIQYDGTRYKGWQGQMCIRDSCGIDLENAWVWDVIKAWFATAYTFFK